MTTITKPTKRHRLTQEDCDTARLLMARQRTLKEIAEIIGVDPSTVGKIRLADYNLEKYLLQRKAMNEKTKENKRAAEAEKMREVLKNRWPKSLQEHMEKQEAENDKKILDQLTEEREAEKAGMTVEMYRFCKNLRKEEEERKRAEEVPGQMQMDLEGRNGGDSSVVPPERNEQNRPLVPEADEQKSMMKFQAAMMDKLLKKLDELIEALTRGRQ